MKNTRFADHNPGKMAVRDERKKWLLHLWEYHTNLLTEEERAEIDRKREMDVAVRIDSDRVRELIEELRQAGRWETHPTFPEEMVDRIVQKEGAGKGKFVFAALVVLVILAYLYSRPTSSPSEVGVTPEQAENLNFALPSVVNGNGERDYSALEAGVEEDLAVTSDLQFGLPGQSSPGEESPKSDGLRPLPPMPQLQDERR